MMHSESFFMMHSGREQQKEYEAAYEKAIGYFDDGLADLSAKADEYGRVKASSKPEEISAINYEGQERGGQGSCSQRT